MKVGELEEDQRYVDLGGGEYMPLEQWERKQEPMKPAGEYLEEEIAAALAAGVSRERIRRHLESGLAAGDDEGSLFFAALMLRRLYAPVRPR